MPIYYKANKTVTASDYETLKKALIAQFADSNLQSKMIDKLLSLRQTGRAQVYANQFLDYRQYVSWDDKYAIYHFNRGLKDELRHDLKMFAEPATLLEWIKIVVNMDDKTYAIENDIKRRDHKDQRKTDSKSNKSSSRAGGQRSNGAFSSVSHSNTSVHSNSAPAPSTSSSNPVPMEVDAIKHGPLSAEEKEHRRREGLCFYCGKGKCDGKRN